MELGGDKIEREFDAVKIIKRIRNFKIMLKEAEIISDHVKTLAKNTSLNVIDLDSDDGK